MNIFVALLIAIGLAADAFAVSMVSGVVIKGVRRRHALMLGTVFGVFQMIMPLAGWFLGSSFKHLISNFDHWLAFVILLVVGGKMIKDSFDGDEDKNFNPLEFKMLITLAVATSIDALAVGISMSILGGDLVVPILIIGAVTFLLSFVGVYLGKWFGHIFEKKALLVGGVILLGIGTKILYDHVMMLS
jgi:putative Mn2+ efflux pump MntP